MNEFQKAVAENRERGDFSNARRIAAEGQICGALVRECLKRGFRVSVFDGEETTVRGSSKHMEIMGALFTTDEDILRISTPTGIQRGSFYLVYGNDGYDVISDYSANETCDAIQAAVDATIAKVEQRLCG
jgi:hypothetical protein